MVLSTIFIIKKIELKQNKKRRSCQSSNLLVFIVSKKNSDKSVKTESNNAVHCFSRKMSREMFKKAYFRLQESLGIPPAKLPLVAGDRDALRSQLELVPPQPQKDKQAKGNTLN